MQRRALLVADNGALLSKENELKSGGSTSDFVPRNVTRLCYPLDQGVIKTLKKKYQLSLLECRSKWPRCLNRTATLQPEPTHASKPSLCGHTFPDVRLLFNPTCLFRLLPTTGLLFRSLRIVGDVNVILCTRLMKTGANFC